MNMKVPRIVFLFLLLAVTARLQAQVTVAKDGQAQAEIVIRDGHGLETAAAELQLWIRAISGAELPVVNAVDPGKLQIVLSCDDETRKLYPEDTAALQATDGYAVRRDGNTVRLFAATPGGVLRGVYRWLYNNTDIIWARPDEAIGTFFSRQPMLVFERLDYIDLPKYTLRGWQFSDDARPNAEQALAWACRNGSNWYPYFTVLDREYLDKWSLLPPPFPFGHNLVGRYITEAKYYESHPEFFPYTFGRRLQPSVEPDFAQLCFSNPEMTRTFIENLEADIVAHPAEAVYMLGIEDNNNLCYCPECLAPITLPSGEKLTSEAPDFHSTRCALFFNRVAAAVREKYPDKRLLCFAYFFTEYAPAVELEDNIDILFCPIYKNNRFPINSPENRIEWDNFRDWLAKKRPIQLYDYYGLSHAFPRAVDLPAAIEMRYAYEHGVRRAHAEIYMDGPVTDSRPTVSAGSWDNNGIYNWVISQLRWDPYADVRELRREFLTRVFGAAAGDLEEYFALVEKAWNAAPITAQYHTSAYPTYEAILRLGLYEKCAAALDRAQTHEIDPNAAIWLERVAEAFRNCHYLNVGRRFIDDYMRALADPAGRKNLVVNSGFEIPSDGIFDQGKPDWEKSGFQGWSLWYLNPGGFTSCAPAPGLGYHGTTAAGATNVYRFCYIQAVEIDPERAYLLRGRAKVTGNLSECYLELVWDGHTNHRLEPGTPDADGWALIEGLIVPPPGVTKARIHAGTFRHDIHETVLFDDIELFELEAQPQ